MGAGLYLASGTTISGSLIANNSGTGVHIAGTGSYLNNCLFSGNSAGIVTDGAADIINCNIVNNQTGLINSTATTSRVINSVFWGNAVEYTLSAGSSLEIAFSAIEGGFSGGTDGGNNIVLSPVNNDNAGPNFINPVSDFHIGSGVSQLIDGGTSSYDGIAIPLTDRDNRQRISNMDIGAYEFLYFLWEGDVSTSWTTAGNWAGWHTAIPSTITENRVVIPYGSQNYPTLTNLTLSSRSTLTIKPGAGLTITRNTTVNSGCTFLIESDETGTGNFITGSRLTGSFQTELFRKGGGDPNYRWHYVIPPVNNSPKSNSNNRY
ncbi:MAG: hypothetical protein MZV63_24350 [Marinilabiliales bacterium]|nr:hypothetical protein [Marinilabiliales bacterium]